MDKKIIWLSLDDAGVFISRRKPYVNHAIALLRTVLYNNGIRTDLTDLRYVWRRKQIEDRLRGYDILLMSVLTFNFQYAVLCAKIFKEVNPDGKVIVGGVHVTVDPEGIKQVKEFDIIVQGPGEKVIVSAIKECNTNYRLRWHTQESSLNNTYIKYPFRSVVFHDSNFFDDTAWIARFISQYGNHTREQWPYWCGTRTNVICRFPDLFKEMAVFTNLYAISLGLESGSDNVLKILNKGCTTEQNYKAIEMCNDLDLTIFANIMLGIPGETRADAMATVDMVNSIKNVIVSCSFYNPYPGTVLGDKVIAAGASLVKDGDYLRTEGKHMIKGIDYKWYYKNILPKIKGYRPPSFAERYLRSITLWVAGRLLK